MRKLLLLLALINSYPLHANPLFVVKHHTAVSKQDKKTPKLIRNIVFDAGIDEVRLALAEITFEEISKVAAQQSPQVSSTTVNTLIAGPLHGKTTALSDTRNIPHTTVWNETLFANLVQYFQVWLKNHGYHFAQIKGPFLLPTSSPELFDLSYEITHLTQTIVSEVAIEHLPEELTTLLTQAANVLLHQPLVATDVEETRYHLAELLWDRGYPDADIKSNVMFKHDGAEALLALEITSGPKVTLESIEFKGNQITKPQLFFRHISLKPGELYSESNMRKTRADLLQLDIFNHVDIHTEAIGDNPSLRKLIIDVEERKRHNFDLGVGASLEDGPRATALYRLRNLLGSAIGLRTRLQLNYPAVSYYIPFVYSPETLANYKQRFDYAPKWARPLLYTEGKIQIAIDNPKLGFTPLDIGLGADLLVQREIRQAFTLNHIGLTARSHINLPYRVSLTPQIDGEWNDFLCSDPQFSQGRSCGQQRSAGVLHLDTGNIWQLTGKISLSYDNRNDILFPKRGIIASISPDLAFGFGHLQNHQDPNSSHQHPIQVRYSKLQGGFTGFVPLFKELIWSSGVKAGHIFQLGQQTYVPLYKRFYLGGTNSIRGFSEDTVLPSDVSGAGQSNTISDGGNFFLSWRNEFRFPIAKQFFGGVFADAGQLLLDPAHLNIKDTVIGTGLGIRYHTPIGPLVADIGAKVYDQGKPIGSILNAIRLHFSIGY